VPGFIGAQIVGAATATVLFSWLIPGHAESHSMPPGPGGPEPS
jgi:hypothetical protein